jgi:predicted DNA binding CopG/RHH family protein
MKKQTKGTDEEIARTTIRIPRSELDKAKIQAIKEHMSLQEWILRAMQQSYMKGGRP